jgi:diaminopimelate epimerase
MSADRFDIAFRKMTGAGNDFVLVDNREARLNADWPRLTRFLCHRRHGIGADGLLVIEPGSGATFEMLYFNADGSSGGMCGNGGRCAALYEMSSQGKQQVTFEALGHTYSAENASAGEVKLHMKDPHGILEHVQIDVGGESLVVHFVDTGSPHAVLFVAEMNSHLRETLSSAGVTDIGRAIRYHSVFAPLGTNVDFVRVGNELSGISLRTYERGVEGETLACGTGSIASAIMASLRYGLAPPVRVTTRGGDVLTVTFEQTGRSFSNVALQGPAREIFSGTIPVDLTLPVPAQNLV